MSDTITMDWSSVDRQEPRFTRPELLTHPNIPKSLHGFNPRTVLGEDWWNSKRKEAYARNNYCCWACGVHQSEAFKHQWLEAHEAYRFDIPECRVYLEEIVALCFSCHGFIHDGHLSLMQKEREITKEEEMAVLLHGYAILRENSLTRATPTISWADKQKLIANGWTLVVDGNEYNQKDWRIFT